MRYLGVFIVVLVLAYSCNRNIDNTHKNEEQTSSISYEDLSSEIIKMEKDLHNHIEADTTVANELIGKYIYFVNTFAEDSLSPEYLLRASEIAANIGQPHNALNYLMRIENEYPDYIRLGFVLYYIGHVCDYFLGNDEQAAIYYQRFIDEYPNHKLVNDAVVLLSLLGKSDIDIIRQFEALNE